MTSGLNLSMRNMRPFFYKIVTLGQRMVGLKFLFLQHNGLETLKSC